MRPGRRRRPRRHHRSRHRMRRHGEDLRLPDEDGDGKRQTPLILLYLRALHPVRLSRRARSLARSLPLRALKSRFLRPRHLHLLPPPPGVLPPSTESSSSEVPSSDDSSAPEHGVGALRDIREGFVVGGGLYTLRTRGRPLRTRGVGERTNGHASCDRTRGQLGRGDALEEEIRTIRTDPDSRPDWLIFFRLKRYPMPHQLVA